MKRQRLNEEEEEEELWSAAVGGAIVKKDSQIRSFSVIKREKQKPEINKYNNE